MAVVFQLGIKFRYTVLIQLLEKYISYAEERSCIDQHHDMFQLDIEGDNSWVELIPGIDRVNGPKSLNIAHRVKKNNFFHHKDKQNTNLRIVMKSVY